MGRLIVFEGPDGVGKTSLTTLTKARKWSTGDEVIWGSFPGRAEGSLGCLVYDLHHRAQEIGVRMVDPFAMQAMHVAAHIDAVNSWIVPKLSCGATIVLDRYWWSTWVYGRASGIKAPALDALIAAESQVWGDILPDPLILVSRTRPVRAEDDTPAWHILRGLYDELADREAKRHRVVRVVNDGDIDDALQLVNNAIDVHYARA